MFCKKCGNEIKDGMKFCGKCGFAVSQPAAPVQPPMNFAPPQTVYTQTPTVDESTVYGGGFYEAPPAVAPEIPQSVAYDAPQNPQYEPPMQPVYDEPQAVEEVYEQEGEQPAENQNTNEPKPKKSKKKRFAILIPIMAIVVAIAILVPTVILPWIQGLMAEPVKRRTSSLAAGYQSSVALKADGTVLATGLDKELADEVQSWTEIVALDSSGYITAGIRKDGTVVFADEKKTEWDANKWTNIDKISVGENHVVGIKNDGTVVAEGTNENGECDVDSWKDIVQVEAAGDKTFAVDKNGAVLVTGDKGDAASDVAEWTDIISISASENITIGLKSDGTVEIAVNDNKYEIDVSDWKNIISVAVDKFHAIALKADGTVLTAGDSSNGKLETSAWEKIVDISTGDEHTIGLKEDGTVVAVGNNDNEQCKVDTWKDIMIPVEETDETTTAESTEFDFSSTIATSTTAVLPNVTEDDIVKLEELLTNTMCAEFNYQTTSLPDLIDNILTCDIAVCAYSSYFSDEAFYDPGSGSYTADPLNKFNMYYRLNADNVKWICENIYHIKFDENYTSNYSYYQNGYIYRDTGVSGHMGSAFITFYKRLPDGKYEVKFDEGIGEYGAYDKLDSYKATVDLQLIDGQRQWTFYSVEKL